eukprot:613835-Rhodomonas_salina.1
MVPRPSAARLPPPSRAVNSRVQSVVRADVVGVMVGAVCVLGRRHAAKSNTSNRNLRTVCTRIVVACI